MATEAMTAEKLKCVKCGTEENILTSDITGKYMNKMYIPVEHEKGSSVFWDQGGNERHVDRVRISFSRTLILCKTCKAEIMIEAMEKWINT